jgi:methyltransferase (TIGR00027 family)
VILAAGLDSRGFRLPWPAGSVVYEVDQPEVIEFKTTTLAKVGATPTAIHRTVGVDLREDWPAVLKANGFDPSQPTSWSAEGLLIYLPPEAQDRLFDAITALSAPGSRLATERVPDLSALTDERFQRLTERLKELGSSIEMADLVYPGERNNVIDYLGERGWDVSVLSNPDAHAANGFELPDDEISAVFKDLSYISAVYIG